MNTQQLQEVDSNLLFSGSETAATSCRSLLIYTKVNNFLNRTLYRIKEHVLLQLNNADNRVIQVTAFFSVLSCGHYHVFVEGTLYLQHAEHAFHEHSGSCLVTQTSNTVLSYASNIVRKVMLYPHPIDHDDPTHFVLVDFKRPDLPISSSDVIVPTYPEVGDMLEVHGDDDEVWYAHVISVDTVSKTCRVKFYTNSRSDNPRKYRPEATGHRVVEVLHWKSILRVASGYWSGNFWYLE